MERGAGRGRKVSGIVPLVLGGLNERNREGRKEGGGGQGGGRAEGLT